MDSLQPAEDRAASPEVVTNVVELAAVDAVNPKDEPERNDTSQSDEQAMEAAIERVEIEEAGHSDTSTQQSNAEDAKDGDRDSDMKPQQLARLRPEMPFHRLSSTSTKDQIKEFFSLPVPALYTGVADNSLDLYGVQMEYALRKLVGADVGREGASLNDVCGYINDDAAIQRHVNCKSSLETTRQNNTAHFRVFRSLLKRKASESIESDNEGRRTRTTRTRLSDEDVHSDYSDMMDISDPSTTERTNYASSVNPCIFIVKKTDEGVLYKLREYRKQTLQDFLASKNDETETAVSPRLQDIYSRKKFLECGLYSNEFRLGKEGYEAWKQANTEDGASIFKFSLPDPNSRWLLEKERDFELPYDFDVWIETCGGAECLKKRLNRTDPTPFRKIIKNIFVERKPRKDDAPSVCDCVPPEDGSMGCGELCFNRQLQIECNPDLCPCGEKCSNQRFQNREEIKDLHVVWAGERGYGLKTSVQIPKGTFIMEYRGEIISSELCKKRMNEDYKDMEHYYFLDYHGGEVVDGTNKGTDVRFVNHSCEPNCCIEKWKVDGEYCIGLFAARDIRDDEELTYDYKFKCFGNNMQRCYCGAPSCRSVIAGSADIVDNDQNAKNNTQSSQMSSSSTTVSLHRTMNQKVRELPTVLKDIFKGLPYHYQFRAYLIRNFVSAAQPVFTVIKKRESERNSSSNRVGRGANRASSLQFSLDGQEFDLTAIWYDFPLPDEIKKSRNRDIHQISADLLRNALVKKYGDAVPEKSESGCSEGIVFDGDSELVRRKPLGRIIVTQGDEQIKGRRRNKGKEKINGKTTREPRSNRNSSVRENSVSDDSVEPSNSTESSSLPSNTSPDENTLSKDMAIDTEQSKAQHTSPKKSNRSVRTRSSLRNGLPLNVEN